MALVAPDESPHRKAVSCYSNDNYIDNRLNLNLEDDILNLDDFKKNTKFVVTVPSPSHKLIGSKLHLKKKHKLSTDGCRKFLSSVIKSVRKNMRSGRHFAQYNSSNIFATHSGRAKFKRVQMFPPGPDTKRLIYECTWKFINDQFHDVKNNPGTEAADIPADINHLINLIRSKPEKDVLFSVHTSLVPEDDRGWSFIKMYEYVKFRASSTHKDLILSRLPYLKNWRVTVYLCDVLVETYEHKNADYTLLGDMKDGKPTTDFGKMLHEAEKFIDFIRNGIARRLQRRTFVTPAQHQRIIDVFFPKLAPEMQEAIYDVIGKAEFEAVFLIEDEH